MCACPFKALSYSLSTQAGFNLLNIILLRLSEAPSKYWLDILHDAGVPCGRVNTIGEVFDDPQVYDLDMVLKIPHPTAGQVVVPGNYSVEFVFVFYKI